MNAVVPTQAGPTREEIARTAYQLWQRIGRPEGRDEAIWLAAERQLRSAAPKRRRRRHEAADEFEERVDELLAEFGAPPPRSPTAL